MPGPRIFLNTLPDGESADGAQFAGASVVDSGVSGGTTATVGPPSLDTDEKQDLRLLYDANGTPRLIDGTGHGISAALSLGPPFVGAEPFSASAINQAGGGISAWPSADSQGRPVVAVLEDFPGGAAQTGVVSGGAGGTVGELAIGRSGLGDGLVAFRQGPFGDAAIVVAQVTAPPVRFVVTVPKHWIKPAQATIAWLPAESANGPLHYSVVLDGRAIPAPSGQLSLRLDTRGLSNGSHKIQVLATDIFGQSTLSAGSTIKVDGGSPNVKFMRTQRGHGVTIRLSDPNSGLALKSVAVSFGDGAHAGKRKSLAHRYAHAGVYQIVVRVSDKLGNKTTVRKLVSVR